MSLVKSKAIQLGFDATPTNNFLIYQPLTPDGTFRIANGNQGATTDIMTVTSGGSVTFAGTTNFSSLNFGAGSESAPSLFPTGDSNTGIWFPAADTFAVSTGGGESLRVTSGGMVWAKSTTLGTKISTTGNTTSYVGADISIGRTGSASGSVGQGSSIQFQNNTTGKAVIIQGNDDKFQIWNNAGGGATWFERMSLTAAGYLGLGDSNPAGKLTVAMGDLGTTAGTQNLAIRTSSLSSNANLLEISEIRIADGTNWSTTASRIQRKVDATHHAYIQFGSGGTGSNGGEGIVFGAGGSTAGPLAIPEVMRITASGYVGIGTNAPNSRLHVGSTTGKNTITIDGANSGTGNGAELIIANNGTTYGGIGNYSAVMGGTYDNSFMVHGWNGIRFNTLGGNRVSIGGTGNVGIGLGNNWASYKLVVQEDAFSAASSSNILAEFKSNKHAFIKLTTTGTGNNSWGLFAIEEDGGFGVYDYASGTYGVSVTKTSNTLTLNGNRTNNSSVMTMRANYSTSYGWKVRTVDRGGGIDLDIIGTDAADADSGGLQMSTVGSGRTLRWRGGSVSHAGDIITLNSGTNYTTTAGVWTKIATVDDYAGAYILMVRWDGAGPTAGGTNIWDGCATGVIALNFANIYNAAPEEILTLSHTYHHRTIGPFEFKTDSDGSYDASYGRQSLYIKHSTNDLSVYNIRVYIRPMI